MGVTPLANQADADQAREYLTRLRRERDQAEDVLNREVVMARRRGLAWSDIGEALGITRQSAHARFADRCVGTVSLVDLPLA